MHLASEIRLVVNPLEFSVNCFPIIAKLFQRGVFSFSFRNEGRNMEQGATKNNQRTNHIPCIFSGCVYQKRALLSLIFNEMHKSLHGLVDYANKSTL